MKIIMIAGVLGILLSDILGVVPNSSVGGSLAVALMLVIAMLAVGLHDAWSNKRGVLGWIVSIVCALIGGFLAISLGGMVSDEIVPLLRIDGPLARSQHPMRYILPAVMMALTIFGSWLVLQIVNRFRKSA